MVTVDSNGRVVLPQEVRKRLGITPGMEVAIHEEDGTVVIEPADDPERIIEHMDGLVTETASERGETTPIDEAVDPISQTHRAAVRSGAAQSTDE